MNLILIFIKLYHLVSVYLENTDVPCFHQTQNSYLLKRKYPDVSNGKAITNCDSRLRNKCNLDREINSHVQLFRTFTSVELHGLMSFFIQRRREVDDVLIL